MILDYEAAACAHVHKLNNNLNIYVPSVNLHNNWDEGIGHVSLIEPTTIDLWLSLEKEQTAQRCICLT